MPTEKFTGAISIKASSVEISVPTGTKLGDVLKVANIAKAAALKKFQPGGCTQCTSGRDFRIREIARVLPEKLGQNAAAFDLKSGKLIAR